MTSTALQLGCCGEGRHGAASVRESFIPCLSAAVIALFCRQYDIIKDNDSNNNKEKTKPSSEHSTPERPSGGLLRSKVSGEGWQEGWHMTSAVACCLDRFWLSPETETPQLMLSP